VTRLRRRFLEMQYCFTGNEVNGLIQKLHALV